MTFSGKNRQARRRSHVGSVSKAFSEFYNQAIGNWGDATFEGLTKVMFNETVKRNLLRESL